MTSSSLAREMLHWVTDPDIARIVLDLVDPTILTGRYRVSISAHLDANLARAYLARHDLHRARAVVRSIVDPDGLAGLAVATPAAIAAEVATNRHTPERTLLTLLDDRRQTVRKAAKAEAGGRHGVHFGEVLPLAAEASEPGCAPARLTQLAELAIAGSYRYSGLLERLCAHPATPPETLAVLAENFRLLNLQAAEALATRPDAPLAAQMNLVRWCISHGDAAVAKALAARADIAAEAAERLKRYPAGQILARTLARSGRVPEATLARWCDDYRLEPAAAAAPNLPTATRQQKLALGGRAVLANPAVPRRDAMNHLGTPEALEHIVARTDLEDADYRRIIDAVGDSWNAYSSAAKAELVSNDATPAWVLGRLAESKGFPMWALAKTDRVPPGAFAGTRLDEAPKVLARYFTWRLAGRPDAWEMLFSLYETAESGCTAGELADLALALV